LLEQPFDNIVEFLYNRLCVLIYLNNVPKGGATFFNELNLRVQPKEGSALIFFPAKMDGTIDHKVLHTAENASDLKWVSQVWLRNKKYSN
jgi:hypothetical protein